MSTAAGELALWRSVVLRAIEDGCGYLGGGINEVRRRFDLAEAREWFQHRDFYIVCDLADLDPDYVRAHALRCIAEVVAGRVPESLDKMERYADAQRQRNRRRRGINVKDRAEAI